MPINGTFVLFLIIAVASFALAVAMKSVIAKVIFFIIAFGAATIATGTIGLDVVWIYVIYAIIFLAVGVSAFRVKGTSHRILGGILTILGVVAVLFTINDLGATSPGTVLHATAQAFQQGWGTFADFLQRVISSA